MNAYAILLLLNSTITYNAFFFTIRVIAALNISILKKYASIFATSFPKLFLTTV